MWLLSMLRKRSLIFLISLVIHGFLLFFLFTYTEKEIIYSGVDVREVYIVPDMELLIPENIRNYIDETFKPEKSVNVEEYGDKKQTGVPQEQIPVKDSAIQPEKKSEFRFNLTKNLNENKLSDLDQNQPDFSLNQSFQSERKKSNAEQQSINIKKNLYPDIRQRRAYQKGGISGSSKSRGLLLKASAQFNLSPKDEEFLRSFYDQ